MPPIRRYLRLTLHSVLEVRIYLDNPTDAHRWLLHPLSPALPRVIAAVRPLVLPKLREENALSAGGGGKGKVGGKGRGGGKGGKRRGWKDVVVVEGDFEVSIFLTETSTRHSILRKEKRAQGEKKRRVGSIEGKMTGTRDAPVEVGEVVLREESEEEPRVPLVGLPLAGGRDVGEEIRVEESEEELFVSEEGSGDEDGTATGGGKRKRLDTDIGGDGDGDDGKKKMALDTEYDGFSIYGRILCLVVKRWGGAKGKEGVGQGQAMMEDWIASTQAGEGGMMDD